MPKNQIKEVEQTISLVTTEGKEIVIEYKIDEDIDDYILDSVREALRNSELYFEDWADFEIKFGNITITELDFKKIIGIRW